MRQKFVVGLMFLSVLLLSSCEKDTWRQGTLDYQFTPVTNSNGYFESRQITYPGDIAVAGYANQINDFSFLSSKVMVTGDILTGDVIRGLMIDIDGVGQFTFPDIPITQSGWSYYIVDSGSRPAYYTFMMNAFNYMRQFGKQDIIVSGYLQNKYGYAVSGANMEVNIYNDLDVDVDN
jgi:hypothetical protein